MNIIDQVVSSDEAARQAVAQARSKARAMVEKARQEAEAMVRAGQDRLLRIEQNEIRPIVTAAEQQAEEKLARTERHIQRLHQAVAEKKDRILEEFIDLVLGGREESSGTTGPKQPQAVMTGESPRSRPPDDFRLKTPDPSTT